MGMSFLRGETKIWLTYSKENFDSANVLLKNSLFNPCLQNVQQSVEKALKTLLIEKGARLKKTHEILELKKNLEMLNIQVDISDENCDFLNSIYLPSKYPLGSVIPDFNPDESILYRSDNHSKKCN
ncbi:DNA-binding protein [Desulfobacter hydrogenophilus]|uniref:DNA-binding protein n=1 Tax=Desulfobacter hydrogenophilus TaxID=2291 RepID=A0A328FAU6_9BACT|nr:HEPN domain-containing protein [Desulfobacter hydrogenophilus]RAM01678.1 DNA-binding protein [Desulfobacter hydrogenophilus]